MLMLKRRLQVLVEESQYERLEREARQRRVSVAVVVRDAIERALDGDPGARREAGERLLAAEAMPVPDVAELRAELDDVRGRRG
jgi:hypothetical protein